MLRAARFIARFGLQPEGGLAAAVAASAARLRDRLRGADPRRARQADRGGTSGRRSVVLRRHRSGRGLPPRAAGPAARARPDPPSQGRAQPHDRGGREGPPTSRRPTARRPTTSVSPGSPPCSTMSASRARVATNRAKARRSTTTTPSARGSRASAWKPCVIRPPTSPRSRRSSPCTCDFTRTRWAGPTRRCAGTCAMPGTIWPSSTCSPDATAPRAMHAKRRRSPSGWTTSRDGSPSSPPHEELAALRPELDGNDVMELLGVGPSRVVGEALDFLLEIRLDEGLIGRDTGDRAAAGMARRAPVTQLPSGSCATT